MSLCEKRCRTTNIVASAKEEIDRASGTTAIGGVSMTMKSNKLFIVIKNSCIFSVPINSAGFGGMGPEGMMDNDAEHGLNR